MLHQQNRVLTYGKALMLELVLLAFGWLGLIWLRGRDRKERFFLPWVDRWCYSLAIALEYVGLRTSPFWTCHLADLREIPQSSHSLVMEVWYF